MLVRVVDELILLLLLLAVVVVVVVTRVVELEVDDAVEVTGIIVLADVLAVDAVVSLVATPGLVEVLGFVA